jgi:hypothetical protein
MWYFFDTLPKEQCVFFLVISVVAFAAFVVMFAAAMFSKNKLANALVAVIPLFTYYLYLLFYSVCVNSLK